MTNDETAILEGPKSLNAKLEGSCIECKALTEAVVLYGGEAEFVCVACQERIRKQP